MAAIPNTIPLGGTIAPTDTTDVYATHMANYGKGGVHHVADITARDAITAERRTEGMFCTVEDDGNGEPKTYQLVGGVTNGDWQEFTSGGGGEVLPSTAVADLPIGSLIAFMGTTIPDDYLECDGRAVSRTTYDQLFAVIGTTYGAGNGTSTFNLPDISSSNGIACIKYRSAKAAEIISAELDYENAIDVKSYFSESKALTIPSNTGTWSGSGYGVETVTPLPSDGWLTIRQLTVDSGKSIIVMTKQKFDAVWQGRAAFPTDPTTAQMVPTFSFPVNKYDYVMVVCINAAAANKTALSVAELIPYKKVAVCGRNGANGLSSGVIDYSRYTNVDLTSSATNINASSATTVCWEVSAQAPYDGAVLINMNLPDAFDASHVIPSMYLDVFIDGTAAGLWPVRMQSNQVMIYGVKKGDTIVSRTQYLKSVSSAKPDVYSFVFHPYAQDNTYSTDELVVGKWIDGKAIYRKVVQGTTPSDSGNDDVIDLTSLSIDTLISISGQINFGSGTFYPLSWPRNTSENDVILHAYKLRLHIVSSNLYNKPFFAIIEYTKA